MDVTIGKVSGDNSWSQDLHRGDTQTQYPASISLAALSPTISRSLRFHFLESSNSEMIAAFPRPDSSTASM
jgi:hypothetical protein